MKKDNSLYPITVKMLNDHREQAHNTVKKYAQHLGAFIGVCELEGVFLCDSAGELFESLNFGERLSLVPKQSKSLNPTLCAIRADGSEVGTLPFSDAILPNMLIRRSLDVFCHIEAKEFNGGMLAVAVSIYCESY